MVCTSRVPDLSLDPDIMANDIAGPALAAPEAISNETSQTADDRHLTNRSRCSATGARISAILGRKEPAESKEDCRICAALRCAGHGAGSVIGYDKHQHRSFRSEHDLT